MTGDTEVVEGSCSHDSRTRVVRRLVERSLDMLVSGGHSPLGMFLATWTRHLLPGSGSEG